jgi:methionine synthase I (cobalamin-dependent)
LDTKEKLLDTREKLDGRVLVGDGALDTHLADREADQPYSMANLTHASAVRAVHEEYLRAGARVIETNTFLANRLKLATHNREENVHDINIQGVRLAREAVDALPRGEEAQNLLMEAKPLVGGAYLMPPASRPHLAGDVIEPIVKRLRAGMLER